jgi:hypothetical protein
VPVQDFSAFFSQATGNQPYPYQRRLGNERIENRLIYVPTRAKGWCPLFMR